VICGSRTGDGWMSASRCPMLLEPGQQEMPQSVREIGCVRPAGSRILLEEPADARIAGGLLKRRLEEVAGPSFAADDRGAAHESP